MELQELGLKYMTDKSKHSYKNITYLDIYSKFFTKMKQDVKIFVEIGVLNGSSLKVWEEFFPNAIIYGIDINPECKKYETNRIKILIGNQNDDSFLEFISKELPKIDILLDDGSHITKHQIKTFDKLYKNINENGLYIIEDLRNSYEEFFNHHNVRDIWPNMKLNDPEDSLKNYRDDFNNWAFNMIKQLDFYDSSINLFSIHYYPMIVIFENIKNE
jgi:hypothetical protein